MITQQDNQQLAKKGISLLQIEKQLGSFAQGFPYLKLESAASIHQGIISTEPDDNASVNESLKKYIDIWERYLQGEKVLVKFVPASGAASRMFKDLFEFLDAPYQEPTTAFEKEFFARIESFAFFAELNKVCIDNNQKDISTLMQEGAYKAVVANLLNADGLYYGALPKGLLSFHSYGDQVRTPLEEHLVEGALYATGNSRQTNIHFTVSSEHRPLFERLVQDKIESYQSDYKVQYNISFSEQKESTDTLAVNADNTPFRNEDGSLLFRPGGHGALIENLNELDADIVFVKNVDNVVPDRLKDDTVYYKKLIAGVLVDLQAKSFAYLRMLDGGNYTSDNLKQMLTFLEKELCCIHPSASQMKEAELVLYLKEKLNRPMRVCGMVKNVGEPGGGPFLVHNSDGSISLQILESSQIDMNNTASKSMFEKGTHFNPVDLVCSLRDYHGDKFDLANYTDPSTGFISHKSKNGKALKALELPGLWNGAMSNWNTIFVEIPLTTFNPVKTVNDLLRVQHQGSL